jgi:hypothetical protein
MLHIAKRVRSNVSRSMFPIHLQDFIASMARWGERKPANKLAQDQPLEAGRHGAPAWICTRPTAN